MLLLNYSQHPLSEQQCPTLLAMLGQMPEVRTIPVQIDPAHTLSEIVTELADAVNLSPHEWGVVPLLIIPAGLAPVALIAEIHDLSGQFPALVRVRPVGGSIPTTFGVVEVMNLQAWRNEVAHRRR